MSNTINKNTTNFILKVFSKEEKRVNELNKKNMTKPKLGDYRVVEKWRKGSDFKNEKYYDIEIYCNALVQEKKEEYKEIIKPVEKSFMGIKYLSENQLVHDFVETQKEIREDKWESFHRYMYYANDNAHYNYMDIDYEIRKGISNGLKPTKKQACDYIKRLKNIKKNKAIPLPEDKVVSC